MKNGINIILYPRSYNLRGHSHSVLGLTSTGKIVNVKLRVDEAYQDQEFTPSIKEFACYDRKAKMPCLASAENGPGKREGLLLFSQCQPDGVNTNNVETYIARWAVVLCEDSESPEPIYGIGRLHINRFTKRTLEIKRKLKQPGLLTDKDAVTLKKSLSNPENYSYPSVVYHPEHLLSFESDFDHDYFCEQVGKAIDQCCKSGMTGGFAVRALNLEGDVISSSYDERFQKFDSVNECFEEGICTASKYIASEKFLSLIGEDYAQIDVIPITRIQSVSKTNAYYARKTQYARISKLFEHELGSPKVCSIVIRPTYYSDEDRTITSRVYTLSSPLGHPMRITRDGRLGLHIEGESKIVTSRMRRGAGKLHRIGLTKNPERLTRNYWVLDNECANVIENSTAQVSSESSEIEADSEKVEHEEVHSQNNEDEREDSSETSNKTEGQSEMPNSGGAVTEEVVSECTLEPKAEVEINHDADQELEEHINADKLEYISSQESETNESQNSTVGLGDCVISIIQAGKEQEQEQESNLDEIISQRPESGELEQIVEMEPDEEDEVEAISEEDHGQDDQSGEKTGMAAFFNF